jgi:hypothetical protein
LWVTLVLKGYLFGLLPALPKVGGEVNLDVCGDTVTIDKPGYLSKQSAVFGPVLLGSS